MKYKITVYSIGYDDTSLIVESPSLREAKLSERLAVESWCDSNAIDRDNRDLPFTTITRIN